LERRRVFIETQKMLNIQVETKESNTKKIEEVSALNEIQESIETKNDIKNRLLPNIYKEWSKDKSEDQLNVDNFKNFLNQFSPKVEFNNNNEAKKINLDSTKIPAKYPEGLKKLLNNFFSKSNKIQLYKPEKRVLSLDN